MTKREYNAPRIRNTLREIAGFGLAILCLVAGGLIYQWTGDRATAEACGWLFILLLLGQARGWLFAPEPEPYIGDDGVIMWIHANGRMQVDIASLVQSKKFQETLVWTKRIFENQPKRKK